MPFHPAPASQLLADFLCTPVAMRPDRHFALCRELALGGGPRELAAREAFRHAAKKSKSATPGAQADDTTEDDESERYIYPWEEPIYTVDGGIAVVEVSGALVKGYDAFTCWYYGMMSTDRLLSALVEISLRADVFAVILRLNTPGGMSTGMPEVADVITSMESSKVTIAFTGDMAASNGMRLAAACSAFFPTRSAVVGCIGTYIALYDYKKYLDEWGVKLELFRDGSLKGIGLMGKELTADERTFLQADVEASGKIFKDTVRARWPGASDADMQGQWFSGEAAVSKGMANATVAHWEELYRRAQSTVASLLGAPLV